VAINATTMWARLDLFSSWVTFRFKKKRPHFSFKKNTASLRLKVRLVLRRCKPMFVSSNQLLARQPASTGSRRTKDALLLRPSRPATKTQKCGRTNRPDEEGRKIRQNWPASILFCSRKTRLCRLSIGRRCSEMVRAPWWETTTNSSLASYR